MIHSQGSRRASTASPASSAGPPRPPCATSKPNGPWPVPQFPRPTVNHHLAHRGQRSTVIRHGPRPLSSPPWVGSSPHLPSSADRLAREQPRRERGEAEGRRPRPYGRPVRQPRPKERREVEPPIAVESATWSSAGERVEPGGGADADDVETQPSPEMARYVASRLGIRVVTFMYFRGYGGVRRCEVWVWMNAAAKSKVWRLLCVVAPTAC